MKNAYPMYLLLFIMSVGLFAQRTSARLTFKDGTELRGLAKLTTDNKVKFRKARKEKKTWYSLSEDLEKVMLLQEGYWVTYVFRTVKDKTMGRVLRKVVAGEVSLYSKTTSGAIMGPGDPGMVPMMLNYDVDNYYVQRKGETAVTHLGSNQIFTKNFKKAASDYFKDCQMLVKKIQNKEFKKRDLEEIVEYYNTACNEN